MRRLQRQIPGTEMLWKSKDCSFGKRWRTQRTKSAWPASLAWYSSVQLPPLLAFVSPVLAHHASHRGRSLSNDFLSLPSKRLYSVYYSIIKKPLALDQIRLQIKSGQYKSLADIRLDFEQCFRNAKRYNLKGSQIWKDAKALHVSHLSPG